MKEKLLITFLLVCVLEGAFASGKIQCPAEDMSMTLEGDENFIAKYQNVDSMDLCGTFCARSDNCKFWTWFSKNSDTTKYRDLDCLLFDSDDQTVTLIGAISGEKTCPSTIRPEPECKDCSPDPIRFKVKSLSEISFHGGDDANYVDIIEEVGDSSLCGKLCAITTPCIYWTWYSSDYGKRKENTCLMFDNIVQLQHNPVAISGEKHSPDPDVEETCPLQCPEPCVIDPEPGPNNAGNSVQLIEKGVMKVFGMAFYVAVMAAIKM